MKNFVLKMFKLKEHIAQKKSKSNGISEKPRTIVCKLLNYKQKEEMLRNTKNLTGSNFFINEDFCHETMQYRKNIFEEVKNLRIQDKIAYRNYRSILVVANKNDTG